jgi:hypothetical protein
MNALVAAATHSVCLFTLRCNGLSYCGVLSSCMVMLQPSIWEYSVSTEVFALNNFFVASLLLVGAQTVTSNSVAARKHSVLVGSLLCALALTNQHTVLLFEASISYRMSVCCNDSTRRW